VRVVLLLGLLGCGRFGFDERSAPADTTPPIDEPRLCNPRTIGTLDITGESAIKLRATQLSTGWAVAVQTDALNTYLARLDTAGAFVSRHNALVGGYALQGISQLQDRPFVFVFVDGAAFIKLLSPDWESYDTGPSSQLSSMDPQQALASTGDYAIVGSINNDALLIQGVDVNNAILGEADYSPPATFASFGAIPTGARVVVEKDGVCTTFAIDDDGPTGPRHDFSPCFQPRIATLGNEGAILYQTGPDGPLALHQIPVDATTAGRTLPLEIGSNPRIATVDGEIWVAYLRGAGTLRLHRFSGEAQAVHDDESITTSFDLIPSGLFSVTSTGELHSATPCL
jgi:hypothetical protein